MAYHQPSAKSVNKPSKLATLQPPREDAAPSKKIAWPLGKVTTNKDVAVVKFLEKKRGRGESLTEDQLRLIERFHAPEAASLAVEVATSNGGADTPSASNLNNTQSGQKRQRENASSSSSSSSAAPLLSLDAKMGMSLDQLAQHRRKSMDGPTLALAKATNSGTKKKTGESKKRKDSKKPRR